MAAALSSVFFVLTLVLTSCYVGYSTASDFDVVRTRTINLLSSGSSRADVTTTNSYLSKLTSTGSFSDINYAAGCSVSRSLFPASSHADRLLTMARTWRNPTSTLYHNANLESKIFLAMGYWFSHDYTNEQCTRKGGVSPQCPCTTAGLWHPNWWFNEIGIPQRFGKTCALMSSSTQFKTRGLKGCTHILNRSNYVGMTGANALWQAQNIVHKAFITNDVSLLNATYLRAEAEVVFTAGSTDSIKRDGMFFQHGGLVYNGGYGTTFMEIFADLMLPAAGTSFDVSPAKQAVFSTLMLEGNRWLFVYRTASNNQTAWDLNVIGRGLAHSPYTYSNSVYKREMWTNLTAKWSRASEWKTFVNTLAGTQAPPTGNRMFSSADMMVHRGPGYSVSVRGFSARTLNSECVNSENTKGLHLADGATYVYHDVDNYYNAPIGWDWNHIPGITVDPRAISLSCSNTKITSRTTHFVGGVSDGKRGIFAMDFKGTSTSKLSYHKSWFFFDDEFVVLTSGITTTVTTQPVHHVLDSRIHKGSTLLMPPGATTPTTVTTGSGTAYPWWLHHDSIGYVIPANKAGNKKRFTYKVGSVTNSWSATATAYPKTPITVNMWTGYLESKAPPVTGDSIEYIVTPNVAQSSFATRANQLLNAVRIVTNTRTVQAVYQSELRVLGVVVWAANATFKDVALDWNIRPDHACTILIASYRSSRVVTITVSDPTQQLKSIKLMVPKAITCTRCTTTSGVTTIPFALTPGATRNWARLNVTLPAIPPAARLAADNTNAAESSHSLSVGVIAAIIICAIVSALALTAVIAFVVRQNRKTNQTPDTPNFAAMN